MFFLMVCYTSDYLSRTAPFFYVFYISFTIRLQKQMQNWRWQGKAGRGGGKGEGVVAERCGGGSKFGFYSSTLIILFF